MKTWIKTSALGLIVAIVICLAARAQLNGLIQGTLTPAQDSIVQITADAMGLEPVALANLPRGGTYWWVNSSGVMAPLPCPPLNRIVPIYAITDNQFLVDDTGGQVAVNTRRLSLTQATTSSLTVSAVDRLGNAVADLIEQIQQTQFERTMMMSLGVPSPGEGGGTSSNSYSSFSLPDYGTNLWIAQAAFISGQLVGVATNTQANVRYEIQSRTNLLQTDWQFEGSIYGSETENWTPLSVAQNGRENLFIRLKSWADSDGSGLPDWWQSQYFGHIGVDPYGNPAGDGWSNLQKFQNGMDPQVFCTPPSPQGVTAQLHLANQTATVNWSPASGTVTGYIVEKTDNGYYPDPFVQTFSVSANATSFADDLASDFFDDFYANSYNVSYRVQAMYGSGNSSWSASALLQQPTVSGLIVHGTNGAPYLTLSGVPANAVAVRLHYMDYNSYSPTFNLDIPVSAITNGIYQLPASFAPPATNSMSEYWIYIQSVDADGNTSEGQWAFSIVNRVDSGSQFQWNDPFHDGRRQLKDNLIFLLRSANVDNTLHLFPNVVNPINYAYSSYLDKYYFNEDSAAPFSDNYLYRNFVYDSSMLNSDGSLSTGWNNTVPRNQFEAPTGDWTTISSVLSSNQTRWLELAKSSLDQIGISRTDYYDSNNHYHYNYSMSGDVKNVYGLPFLSTRAMSSSSSGTLLYPGNHTADDTSYNYYTETVHPQFQSVEYDFWIQNMVWNDMAQWWVYPDLLPGETDFATTSQSRQFILAAVNSSIKVAGYAKLAIQNGNAGVYGYLGQYFDQAYKMTNGIVTTSTTGILSPYGDFFATEPGSVALVTMPDLDTCARGTGMVYCVSLQLDKNHDGNMDLKFNGTDATSQASPMVWWINDDYDYTGSTGDLGHDVSASWYYNDGYIGSITSQRDCEDYARLWICGMPSLTNSNYQVTLSWANVSSGSPTINLFYAVETNGGIGYLTNLDTATAQISGNNNWVLGGPGRKIATISPSHSFTFPANYFTNAGDNYFLFDGAITNGVGELLLTITDGNGNTIAQTGAWLDLQNIKDFYERAVITNNSGSGAISNWTSGVEIVQQASASALGDDKDIIVLVHGINVGNADWLTQSDTVLKRLYWTGYHGKFATVKWPCNFLTPPQPITFDVFNLSEAKAYKSAQALANYLSQLHARFPDHRLHLLAHSQGNAVVSEAIAQSGVPVDTYIITQGAIAANAYDVNAPIHQPFVDKEVGFGITPEWQPWGYRGIYTNLTGKIVNLYNPQDGVLAIWQIDQIDNKPSGYYSYDGTDCWYVNFFFIKHLVTDFQETRSMISRSRTLSIGQSGPASAHGVIQSALDLNAQFGFNTAIAEHSAQWTRPIQTSLLYYNQVLLQIRPLQ